MKCFNETLGINRTELTQKRVVAFRNSSKISFFEESSLQLTEEWERIAIKLKLAVTSNFSFHLQVS